MSVRELSDLERQELVAYLADEADGPMTERVEALLTSDAAARLEKERLEQSWRMLELLDRPKASADFLSRTASLAMTVAREPTAPIKAPATRPFKHWWAPIAATGFAAGWLATFLTPNPHGQLLQDFPVFERFDELACTRSLTFLAEVQRSRALETPAKGGTP
jgi:hypothetical protein